MGGELYLSCPCPDGKNVFGLGSKLVAAYAVATGTMPRRRDRITKNVFRIKLFRFKTRTVKKDKDGHVRPAQDHYSHLSPQHKARAIERLAGFSYQRANAGQAASGC